MSFSRWLSRIAEPASSARSAAAQRICPGWPRSAWMRGSKGVSEARAASTDTARQMASVMRATSGSAAYS